MGLLDLFKSHANEPSFQLAKSGDFVDIASYAYMRVEVTSLDGRLLFTAKFARPEGNTAELFQDSIASISRDTEPLRVHIRGYHSDSKKAVYMEGTISPMPVPVWKVDDLVVDHVGNDRTFFRLEMNINARVTKFGGQDNGEYLCKLLNISVGGARISTLQRFWEGDRLLLNVQLSEGGGNSAIFCKVLRVIEKKDSPFEYGCQFLELTEADQDKITQNIFDLQRKMRGSVR